MICVYLARCCSKKMRERERKKMKSPKKSLFAKEEATQKNICLSRESNLGPRSLRRKLVLTGGIKKPDNSCEHYKGIFLFLSLRRAILR